jgi:hypothetical protein
MNSFRVLQQPQTRTRVGRDYPGLWMHGLGTIPSSDPLLSSIMIHDMV